MRLGTLFVAAMAIVAISESTCKAAPVDAELAANRAASCHVTAQTNYDIALAIGAPDADMVVENTMADCEQDYSYADAIAIADSLLSCGIDRVGDDRWVVVQVCDSN